MKTHCIKLQKTKSKGRDAEERKQLKQGGKQMSKERKKLEPPRESKASVFGREK